MRDHERIEELMAVRALGGLDPEDDESLRRQMAEHGEACPECRRLESEFDEVAGRLAFALDPVPVRGGFEDQVVAAAAGHPSRPVAPVDAAPGTSRPASRPFRALVAVAASIVLFAAGLAVGVLATRSDEPVPPRARVVAFQGEAEGSLSVAFRPGGDGVFLLGSGLQQLPEDQVYEVWMFQGGTPVPATCFRPTEDGSVFEFVDSGLGTTDSMAVTVEPSTCPSAPTTSPILTAQIV